MAVKVMTVILTVIAVLWVVFIVGAMAKNAHDKRWR